MDRHNFNLPADSPEWARIVDEFGGTLAHKAARSGNLPEGFNQWDIATKYGLTVAHEAAAAGHLPAGFNLWGLADEAGVTVAHFAAAWGRLPGNVPDDVLALIDNMEMSVAEAVLESDESDPELRERAEAVVEKLGKKTGPGM
jgi:hypothetical protein